eukprot:CAMPEP_0184373394 /NCGR_PEP_ID=MMETSP1089-20130417/164479_1 /TAXON_ID=38269 ORGANISM="Gloeochaete wittrockiana, Strain SAG46.84" /NCGR_SAMPLE_ID=MMETSP1089 /ASSEMBLY_ACC=CAM_ASM_000445 /LENGTH=176 /DNA_ID=CAMNT_0026716353 /DNA_START=18 /DNA_END=549 /DNA_ORIENTATION=+
MMVNVVIEENEDEIESRHDQEPIDSPIESWENQHAGAPLPNSRRKEKEPESHRDLDEDNHEMQGIVAQGHKKVSSQRTIGTDDIPDQLLLLIFRHASRSSSPHVSRRSKAVDRLFLELPDNEETDRSSEYGIYDRQQLCRLSATAKSLIWRAMFAGALEDFQQMGPSGLPRPFLRC